MWKKDETPKGPPQSGADLAPSKEAPKASFGGASKPTSSGGSSSSGRQAIIGGSLVIDGNIKGSENLLIEGKVNGDVSLPSHSVTVGPSGEVKATIRASSIIVDGKVEGDLIGDDQIEIRSSGNVLGNIVAPRVGLEDGAQFKGNIDMSAKPKSNVTSVSSNSDEQVAGQTSNAKLSG